MITTLLNLIVVKGVHLASRTEVKDLWNELHEDIYLNPSFAGYKAIHYKKGDYRYLRDTFKRVLATVSEDMRSGNKSKYSGDLSKQYSLVEQIVNEMNEQNELKESKKEDAAEFEKLLEETEAKVLRKKEYGKRKDVDGNLTDYSEGKRRAGNPTDEAIAVMADAIKASIASKVDEGKVEKDIMTWIQMTNRGIADLLFASDIPMTNKFYADVYDLIDSVGLKLL